MTGSILALSTVAEVRDTLDALRSEGKSVGLVPTMGALHEGHLSLIRRAVAENDTVVVSIFVNPAQFGAGEDLALYPRDMEGDLKLSAEAGADMAFCPTVEEMYPPGNSTWVEVKGLTEGLCGRSRPGHFRGVCTVVAKLLAICEPERAYFGEKDAQQLAVIERMVKDLRARVEIVPCPIVRESDGLAMSSRNVRLSAEARAQAPVLYKALEAARVAVEEGERSVPRLKTLIQGILNEAPLAEIDYVDIVDAANMTPLEELRGKCLVALAVRFGDVRLIDNVRVAV